MWVPPGGHADSGESILSCARRELLEETGYDAPYLRPLLAEDDIVPGWPPYRLTFFWCLYDGVQSTTCREGQALEFVQRTAAADFPIPPSLLTAWDAALAAAGISPAPPTS